jgi:putative transposase
MPRHARLDAPGTLHHIIGRSILGTKAFGTKKDKDDFLLRLAERNKEDSLAVYAWALMDNHFHILVRTGNVSLSSSMRKILTGYVVNFNHRHRRYGHLFQNRFKSIVCEDDPYLLELTRYIHLNPLRAGKVKDMKELDVYPWTGHSVIMGTQACPWQDRDAILAYFGTTEGPARELYHRFVEGGMTMGRKVNFSGGGLVRSSGGWSEVVSMRRRHEPTASDARILGSSTFVETLLKSAGRITGEIMDLPSLALLIAEKEGFDVSDLRSASRKSSLVRARRILSQMAVKKYKYSGAMVARYLGVTTSLVNRMVQQKEVVDLDSYVGSSL